MKYGGITSDPVTIPSGMPQGSVLGPTLFLMLFNSLLSTISSNNAVAYAEDVTLVCDGSKLTDACKKMQQLLDSVFMGLHEQAYSKSN